MSDHESEQAYYEELRTLEQALEEARVQAAKGYEPWKAEFDALRADLEEAQKVNKKLKGQRDTIVANAMSERDALKVELAQVRAERDVAREDLQAAGERANLEIAARLSAEAERDAAMRQSEVLAADVADARLATLRECYRLLSANGWCGATSGSGILELIDAEENWVGK